MEKRILDLLRYFYSCNKIPVWITDDRRVHYTSAPFDGLRSEAELCSFFRFLTDQDELPKPVSVNDIELFACFAFVLEGERRFLIVGPALNVHPIDMGYKKNLAIDYIYHAEVVQEVLLSTPSMGTMEFSEYVALLAELFTDDAVDPAALAAKLTKVSLKKVVDTELSKVIFDLREEDALPRHSYRLEQRYILCVKRGAPDELKKLGSFWRFPVKGVYAPKSPNLIAYEAVAALTLVTRAAIEGGMFAETAYNLSDLYLKKIDSSRTREELLALMQEILYHFAEKVQEAKQSKYSNLSVHVAKALQYVQTHLHYSISLEDAAEFAGVNSKYLSRIFIRQVGQKFTQYVQQERIEEAKELLIHTDYSVLEISSTLTFATQSYFIKVFAEFTSLTPQKFRDKYRII